MTTYSDYSAEDLRLARQEQKWLESRPVCDICLGHITADWFYEIDGKTICPDCMEEKYLRIIFD